MSAPIRTFDVRVWLPSDAVTDSADPMLVGFLDAVRALAAERYPAVSVRWVCERRARDGGPRVRVHPPPPFDRKRADEASTAA